jgi:hypothetical protein
MESNGSIPRQTSRQNSSENDTLTKSKTKAPKRKGSKAKEEAAAADIVSPLDDGKHCVYQTFEIFKFRA